MSYIQIRSSALNMPHTVFVFTAELTPYNINRPIIPFSTSHSLALPNSSFPPPSLAHSSSSSSLSAMYFLKGVPRLLTVSLCLSLFPLCSFEAPSNKRSVRRNHPNQHLLTLTSRRWQTHRCLPPLNYPTMAPEPLATCSGTHIPTPCT